MVVAGVLLQEAMTENCCWMQGRLFQLWQCVRDLTEQIEKIPPPPLHIFFLSLYF